MSIAKSENEFGLDQMMSKLPPAKTDAEIEAEYGALLEKSMTLYRRAMFQAQLKDVASTATELVVSLKKMLTAGFQHVVECANYFIGWADALVPAFNECDGNYAFATRGLGRQASPKTFTKQGHGCSLTVSIGECQPEFATMRLALFSADGSKLQPFELTVMDADTKEFYLSREVIYDMSHAGMKLKSGNYIMVAIHEDKVATLKHLIG